MCKVVARAAIAEPASIAFHKEWNRSAPQQPVPLGNIGAQLVNSGLVDGKQALLRSEEHTSELQSLMRISYAVYCLKKKNDRKTPHRTTYEIQTVQRNKK